LASLGTTFEIGVDELEPISRDGVDWSTTNGMGSTTWVDLISGGVVVDPTTSAANGVDPTIEDEGVVGWDFIAVIPILLHKAFSPSPYWYEVIGEEVDRYLLMASIYTNILVLPFIFETKETII